MFKEYYIDVLEEWLENHRLWENGEHPDQLKYPEARECRFYAEWADNPPQMQVYNPNKWTEEEAACYQVYENVSEGTPFSPVFDSLKEVEDWLVNAKRYSRSGAQELCETGFALTASGQIAANSPLLHSGLWYSKEEPGETTKAKIKKGKRL